MDTKYQSLFDGKIRRLNCKVKISDPKMTPTVSPLRRIPPFALFDPGKKELQQMEKMGIIEPVTQPTEWVRQMVVVEKKGDAIQIFMDPRPLNQAIKRSHFPFQTFDEIAARMKKAKTFCKLDALSGFSSG